MGSHELGIAKGPKRTLELFNYMLDSRPLADPCLWSLRLNLDLNQNQNIKATSCIN